MSNVEKKHCDLMIHAGFVVPVHPHGVVLPDHCVMVNAHQIVGITSAATAHQEWEPKCCIRRPNSALLPGLINAHAHSPMTLLRGLSDDVPLMEWLQKHIWPVEQRVMGEEFVADGTVLAIAEMLRGGTTCVNENYFFPDVQANIYHRFGFRATVGAIVIHFPSAWAKSDAQYIEKAETLCAQWHDNPLIQIAIAPHAPYSVNDTHLVHVRALSTKWNAKVHLHLHETAQEIHDSLKEYGKRPIKRIQDAGLWNNQLLAVHMTQLDQEEIDACVQHDVSIVHCPESNLKLASGFCPIGALQRAGARIALGTDGCASNNDLDMFGEMRTAALLAKAVANDPTALNAASTLHAATLGGARALGWDHAIGSIEIGKQADLICIDLSPIEAQPLHNVLSHIVYCAGRQHVSDVWIAGQRKLRAGQLEDMDVEEIRTKAHYWRTRIRAT